MPFNDFGRQIVIALVILNALWALGFRDSTLAAQEPENQREQSGGAYYVPIPVNFRDVDVATFLRRLEYFGVELPFEADGRVSANLRAELPIGALNEGAAYRFRGRLTSPALTIEGQTLTDVAMTLDYDEGVLRLEELRFNTPVENQAMNELGEFVGAGVLQVVPRGDLTLRMSVRNLDVGQVLTLVPELNGFATGKVAATVQTRVPATRIGEIQAWTANGQVDLQQVQVRDLPPTNASAGFQLADRVLTLTELTGAMRDAVVKGRGTVRLEAPFPYQANAELQLPDAMLFNELQQAVQANGGSLELTARLDGNGNPWTVRAKGGIVGRDLVVEGLRVDRASFDYSTDLTTFTLSNLSADAYGGTITGEAGLRQGGNGTADIRWRDVAAGDLVKSLVELPVDFRAVSSGQATLAIPLERPEDPANWFADGELNLRDIEVAGVASPEASARLQLSEGIASVTNARVRLGETANSVVTGSARVPLDETKSGTADVRWTEIAVPELLEQLGLDLPVTGGSSSGAATVEIPLAHLNDPATWTGRGQVSATEIEALDLRVARASSTFDIADGIARIEDLHAELFDGNISGIAAIPLTDDARGSAEIRWQGLTIVDAAARFLPDVPIESGSTDGLMNVSIPPGTIDNPRAWQADGQISTEGIAIYGWRDVGADAAWSLENERLIIRRATAGAEETRISATGDISLAGSHDYSLLLDLADADLQKLNTLPEAFRLPVQLDGRVSLSAELSGLLEPMSAIGSGRGHASDVQFDEALVDSVDFRFAIDPSHFRLINARAELYDGLVEVDAAIPLDQQAAADADVRWASVDVGQPIADLLDLPIRLEAISSGDLVASSTPGGFQELANWQVQGMVNVPALLANGANVGHLEAEIQQQEGRLEYSAAGVVLDGRVAVMGHWSEPEHQENQSTTELAIQRVDLSRLRLVFPRRDGIDSLTGYVDSNVTVFRTSDGESTARGVLVLTDLGWESYDIAPRLQGRIEGSMDRLVLSDFAGPFAGGRLRLGANVNVAELDRSTFTVSLSSAEIPAALALYWPEASDYLGGRMDVQGRGRLGRRTTLMGTASVREATVSGFAVRGTRVPLNLEFDPMTGRGRIYTSGMSAQLARGRVAGRLSIQWSNTASIDGDLRFTNIDLPTLLDQMDLSGGYGSGRLSGRLTLGGRGISSLNDVTGTLQASLRDAQAFSYPVFQQVRPFLAGTGGGTTFDEGDLEARIQGGRLRISSLTLTSPSLQMFVDGDVAFNGLMNLNVAAATSRSNENPVLAQFLLRQLPSLATPIPASVLLSANEFLTDRVIYLQVTGSINRPRVRLLPAPLLRDAAIRFFLEQISEQVPFSRGAATLRRP